MKAKNKALLVLISSIAILCAFVLTRPTDPPDLTDPSAQRASNDEEMSLAIEQASSTARRSNSGTPLPVDGSDATDPASASASNEAPDSGASALEEIARRAGVSVDALRHENLANFERDEFLDLLHHTNVVAREHEAAIIKAMPPDAITTLSLEDALRMYRDNPNAYFARIPGSHRANEGSTKLRYVDLTDVATGTLTVCREFAVAASGHPSFEAAQILAHEELVERKGPNGLPGAFPVAEWVAEDFGQRLAGYDSSGNLVAEVKSIWPGVPLF